MQAPQRMHLSEYQKSGMPSRCVRPLSTKTMCSSAPGRGARKCEVYCVMGEPSALRQHADEHAKVLDLWNDLLDADADDVQLGHIGGKVGIAFVGTDDEAAVLGDRKIRAGHTGFGAQEIGARVLPHCLG